MIPAPLLVIVAAVERKGKSAIWLSALQVRWRRVAKEAFLPRLPLKDDQELVVGAALARLALVNASEIDEDVRNCFTSLQGGY